MDASWHEVNTYTALFTSHEQESQIDRLVKLFSKEKCMLDQSSMRMLAGFSMHNSEGSDQATVLQYDVAWNVIFMELGLDISNDQLAKGSPCQTSMHNADYRLVAECYLMVAYEMKNAKYYGLSQDAGHRHGLDHLIKTITYPVRWQWRYETRKCLSRYRCMRKDCPRNGRWDQEILETM